ncbi:MAG: hypothetical protein ACKPKO_36695, partial [Candidatus Fonsibacter sp.]
MENMPSVLKKGLIPGGGETMVVHSQLSAFHLMDSILQECSRARTTDAIIFFSVDEVRHKLMVAMSGVLVTKGFFCQVPPSNESGSVAPCP